MVIGKLTFDNTFNYFGYERVWEKLEIGK